MKRGVGPRVHVCLLHVLVHKLQPPTGPGSRGAKFKHVCRPWTLARISLCHKPLAMVCCEVHGAYTNSGERKFKQRDLPSCNSALLANLPPPSTRARTRQRWIRRKTEQCEPSHPFRDYTTGLWLIHGELDQLAPGDLCAIRQALCRSLRRLTLTLSIRR